MATSTISVPSLDQIGVYGPAAAKAVIDVATAAKADIEGISAASLTSSAAAQSGTAAAGNATTAARGNHVHPPSAQCIRFAADGSAGATTAETVVAEVKAASTVAKLYLVGNDALTADDTNYATITVKVRDGAGGAASTVASKTTKITGGSGDWTAFSKIDMGSLSNAVLAAGSVLTATVAKSGTGVQLPGWALVVEFG